MILSKHRCLGQERRRLLEAAEKTVSRSFIVFWLRRESVSHASGTVVYFADPRMRCRVERMCGCVCVVVYVWFLIKTTMTITNKNTAT